MPCSLTTYSGLILQVVSSQSSGRYGQSGRCWPCRIHRWGATLLQGPYPWKGWLFQGVAYLCPKKSWLTETENGNGIPLDWLGEWLVLIEWLGEWAGYHSRGMSWDGNGFKWNLNTLHFGGCLVHLNHAHPLTRWIDRIPRVKRLGCSKNFGAWTRLYIPMTCTWNMARICMESLASCYFFPAFVDSKFGFKSCVLGTWLAHWWDGNIYVYIHFPLKTWTSFIRHVMLWFSIWWSMRLFIQVWDVKSWPIDTAQTFERLGLQHSLMLMFFGPAVSLT